ncbi:hypothetical protein E2C01_075583 [Portunus trituberculatus]|uniref:Uncharacterized protein n=1 Tax=Portunus trituberculatus TaxID=210409 RepID=A0A5B7IFB6_PORTR|nr:hypothetical protein [Portunus trituberculatus]
MNILPTYRVYCYSTRYDYTCSWPCPQIEENTRQLERLSQLMEQEAGTRSDSPFSMGSWTEGCTISRDRPSVTRRSAAAEKWKMGAKKTLLEWVRQTVTK